MFPIPLTTSLDAVKEENFWTGVLLYHNRPHLINRKLAAVSQVLFCEVDFHSTAVKHVSELLTRSALLYEIRKLKQISKENITTDFIKNLLDSYDKSVVITEKSIDSFKTSLSGVFISVRILLPRGKHDNKCIEVVILDKGVNKVTFFAVTELEEKHPIAPPFPYKFDINKSNNMRIVLESFEDADTSSAEWLEDKLFTKIIKWANEFEEDKSFESLSLINIDEYHALYASFKTKYGDPLVKVWSEKANTDPRKFVYEDLAIATYLICLWKIHANKTKIKFIDLGCGNGLLVHILNQEGYEGYGVDLRKRAIWDIYPESTVLKVETVTSSSTYRDVNWIIGNHSDELTPWIPVMALKGNEKCNFFVLPCCPYDFNGQKFIRIHSSISQYSDYLSYIKDVCIKCGFNTKVDKLRIPSTKRTCFVGIRDFSENNFNDILKKVNELIDARCTAKPFTPRPATEQVRNCTQIDRSIIKRILQDITSQLLRTKNVINKNGKNWNKGSAIHLSELSNRLPKEVLKELKNQCGGLQTLIKNHRHIFDLKNGELFLKEPLLLDSSTMKYKDKLCWFQQNHPDGCLYNSENCAYKHV